MGMVTIPSLLPFPNVSTAFGEDGTPTDPRTKGMTDTFITELMWYIEALSAQRKTGVPY